MISLFIELLPSLALLAISVAGLEICLKSLTSDNNPL